MTSPGSPIPIRLRSALVLVAVFLAGGAAGAGVMRAVLAPPAGEGRPPPFPYREIGLTPAQEAQVREILDRNKPRAAGPERRPAQRALSAPASSS